jgi:protein-tyrosine phosphatase
VGRGIEKNAAAILDVNGYDSDNHQARKINVELINESDLVLVMEKTHRDFIIERYPLASGKVFLLSQWNDGFEIADPYRKSKEMFSHVFDRIQKSCFDWIVKLGI